MSRKRRSQQASNRQESNLGGVVDDIQRELTAFRSALAQTTADLKKLSAAMPADMGGRMMGMGAGTLDSFHIGGGRPGFSGGPGAFDPFHSFHASGIFGAGNMGNVGGGWNRSEGRIDRAFDQTMESYENHLGNNRSIARAAVGMAAGHFAYNLAGAMGGAEPFRTSENMTSVLGGLGGAVSLVPKFTPHGIAITAAAATLGKISDNYSTHRRGLNERLAEFSGAGFDPAAARRVGDTVDPISGNGFWAKGIIRRLERGVKNITGQDVRLWGNGRQGDKAGADLMDGLSAFRVSGMSDGDIESLAKNLAGKDGEGIPGATRRIKDLTPFALNPYFSEKAARSLRGQSGGLGSSDVYGMVLSTDTATAVAALAKQPEARRRAAEFGAQMQRDDFAIEYSGALQSSSGSKLSLARSAGLGVDTGGYKSALSDFVLSIEKVNQALTKKISDIKGTDDYSRNLRANLQAQVDSNRAQIGEVQYGQRLSLANLGNTRQQTEAMLAGGAADRALFGRNLGQSPKELDAAIQELEQGRLRAVSESKRTDLGPEYQEAQKQLAEQYRNQGFAAKRNRFNILTLEPVIASSGYTSRQMMETAFYAGTAGEEAMTRRLGSDEAALGRTLNVQRDALRKIEASPYGDPNVAEDLRNQIQADTLKRRSLQVQQKLVGSDFEQRGFNRQAPINAVERSFRSEVREGWAVDRAIGQEAADEFGQAAEIAGRRETIFRGMGPGFKDAADEQAAIKNLNLSQKKMRERESRINFRPSADEVVNLGMSELRVDLFKNSLQSGGWVPNDVRDQFIGDINSAVGTRKAFLSSITDPKERQEAAARLMPEIGSLLRQKQQQMNEREMGAFGHILDVSVGAAPGFSYGTTIADVRDNRPGASPAVGGDGSMIGVPQTVTDLNGYGSLATAVGGTNGESLQVLRSIDESLKTIAQKGMQGGPTAGSTSGNPFVQINSSPSGALNF